VQNRQQRESQLGKVGQAAQRKYGGAAWAGAVNVKDPDTGETLYSNKDVVDMAKWNLARGGQAASEYDIIASANRKDIDEFEKKYWLEEVTCPHCKSRITHYYENIYEKGWRCWSCWQDNLPIAYPEGQEERIKATYPYVNRYVEFKYNDLTNRRRIIKIYLNRVLKIKSKSENQ
jgi:hypothetical protein